MNKNILFKILNNTYTIYSKKFNDLEKFSKPLDFETTKHNPKMTQLKVSQPIMTQLMTNCFYRSALPQTTREKS